MSSLQVALPGPLLGPGLPSCWSRIPALSPLALLHPAHTAVKKNSSKCPKCSISCWSSDCIKLPLPVSRTLIKETILIPSCPFCGNSVSIQSIFPNT